MNRICVPVGLTVPLGLAIDALVLGAVNVIPEWARVKLGLEASKPLSRALNDRMVRAAVASMRWALASAPTALDMARDRVAQRDACEVEG